MKCFSISVSHTNMFCFNSVYLQADCLCHFLHQAIIDRVMNSFLPGDGTGQHLSDVFPQLFRLVDRQSGRL